MLALYIATTLLSIGVSADCIREILSRWMSLDEKKEKNPAFSISPQHEKLASLMVSTDLAHMAHLALGQRL